MGRGGGGGFVKKRGRMRRRGPFFFFVVDFFHSLCSSLSGTHPRFSSCLELFQASLFSSR